jgi:hypothetical protein
LPKFKKKPIEIEAFQLRWDTWNEICDFVDKKSFGGGVYLHDKTKFPIPEGEVSNTIGLWIETLKGRMLATQNDWIIKGINEELYLCKPDVFEKIYERVCE